MIYFFTPIVFYTISAFTRSDRLFRVAIFIAFIVFMVSLAGFRWETGTDWIPYYEHYNAPGERVDFELGYDWWVSVIAGMGLNYSSYLFLCASISVGMIAYSCSFFRGESLTPLLLFYSFYYLGGFLGAQRRQFAIALCFLSIIFIVKRWFLPFLLVVIAAATFHVSALFFMFSYFVYGLTSRAIRIGLAVASVVFFGISIFGFSELIIAIISGFDLGIYGQKVITYASESSEYELSGGGGLGLGFLKRFFVFCLLFSVRKKFNEDHPFHGMLNLYGFSVVMYVLFMSTVAMFSVLTIYYSIVEVLLISYAMAKMRGKAGAVAFLFVIYMVFQVFSILWPYWDLYVPYISIFEGAGRKVLY